MEINKKSFVDGINEIVQIALTERTKPVLISVHGLPNSGKTELCKRVMKELFAKKGWSSVTGTVGDSPNKMGMRLNPDCVFMEDMTYTASVDNYARELFGRMPDLRVYIARDVDNSPSHLKELFEKGSYGIIIENPEATVKQP